MKLTTKGRYAVTAMLDIAINQQDKPVTLADISLRQDLSQSYLEQLFSRLRKKELVISVRGPGGGYRLAKPMADISIAEIILAINEPVDVTLCGGAENCKSGKRCITHNLWEDLNTVIFQFLNNANLQQLVDSQKESIIYWQEKK